MTGFRGLLKWLGLGQRRSSPYQNRRPALRPDVLEDRLVPSGNVIAQVIDGNLTIQGDSNFGNAIRITQMPDPGVYEVTGLNGGLVSDVLLCETNLRLRIKADRMRSIGGY